MSDRGTEWLRQHRILPSPLGGDVADLLEDLVGLHHLKGAPQIDWAHPLCVEVPWHGALSSFDDARLSTLLFLAHDRCLRVEVQPRSYRRFVLLFHRRARAGDPHQRHPTLEEAVAAHRRYFPAEGNA
jgi:hypothetical protein